jgi:hypothetical protein
MNDTLINGFIYLSQACIVIFSLIFMSEHYAHGG